MFTPCGLAEPSLSGQRGRLGALAVWGQLGDRQPLQWGGEQGVPCDSWAYNVGIVPSLCYIYFPKNENKEDLSLKHLSGPQGRAAGCSSRAKRDTDCSVAARPSANLIKARDVSEKYCLSATALLPHPV